VPFLAPITESRINLPTQNVATGTTDLITRNTTMAAV
jgi:hypothetical protein